jgi:archaellum component FlaC
MNYGDNLTIKNAVEYAPKFDYEVLEKENKEIMKTYEPVTNELKKLKRNYKHVQEKYNKLQANNNFTKTVKKKYESHLESLREQLKEL